MTRVNWIAASACACALLVLCFVLVNSSSLVAAGALGSVLFVTLLLVIPRWSLPSLALLLFTLVPVGYMPSVPPIIGRYLSPAIVVLAIWLGREIHAGRVQRRVLPAAWLGAFLLLLLLSATSALWSSDAGRTLLWTLTLGLAFLGPAAMSTRPSQRARRYLTSTWLVLGVAVGLMAIVEGLTKTTFLAELYANPSGVGIGVNQNWSSVRATTTLGHPLMNGTFLACTAGFGFIHAFSSRNLFALVAGVVATAGAVFTVSRSAVAGLIAGLVVGSVIMLCSKQMSFSKKFIWSVLAAAVGVSAVTSPLLSERAASAEGTSSAEVRAVLLHRAFEISGSDGFTGSGAGTSQLRATQAGLSLSIENSYGGLLVSIGLVGLALFFAVLFGLCVSAVRRNRPDIAAAVVTFSVTVAAFPLIDNVPTALILLGLLAYLNFSPSEETGRPQDTSRRVRVPILTSVNGNHRAHSGPPSRSS